MQNEPLLPFQIGEICADRYRVERLLGRGGMGVVYAAVHCFTGGQVALKVLYEPVADLPARMEQEARALAAIRHRHVVRVLDGGATAQGVVWFAMELLEGRILRERMIDAGRLPLPVALRYAREIASGVSAAHAAGVIHRDLKPENVFVVEPEDEIRVVDFGTAKFRRGSLKTTHRMRVLGTYAYMAPERFQGHAGDPRSDVYSLGHVLYELFAGRHAFSEGPGPLDLPPVGELGMRHMMADPRPLWELRPEVPARIAELVHRMLEKHPVDRPQALAEVVAVLEAAEPVDLGPAPAAPAEASGLCTAPLGSRAARPLGADATGGSARAGGDTGAAPTVRLAEGTSGDARGDAPGSRPDWLQRLRPGEYPACGSLEAQAMLGAVRFSSHGEGGRRVERDLAALLSADAAQVRRVEEAAIAMTVLGRDERAALRARLREWAGALDPAAALRARDAVAALVERARTNAPRSFCDDALRATRVLVGASTLPPRPDRDPGASEALFRLASASLEDVQLAHFGLLLLTRFGSAEQQQLRDALWLLAVGAEAQRDAARACLGQRLAESMLRVDTLRPRPGPRGAPRAPHAPAGAPAATPAIPPRRSSVWAASIDRRWVPLILTSALLLGALLAVLVTVPRLAAEQAATSGAEQRQGALVP